MFNKMVTKCGFFVPNSSMLARASMAVFVNVVSCFNLKSSARGNIVIILFDMLLYQINSFFSNLKKWRVVFKT